MNEQRTQTYLNLINQLLSCNNGDEPRILLENQELLDEGLVQGMVAVAQQLGNAGRENEAQWLLNMAQQLAEALGLFDSEPSSISTGTFDQMPHTVYVLLYNVGTDNEGIHTISNQEKNTILIFESSVDAANFARQLGEQNFPVPSVEAMKAEEIFLFCHQLGHNWEFVPQGTNRTSPSQNKTINQQDTFVDQSSQAVTLDIGIFDQQDYLNFLMEVLQKVADNPNPDLIYPFLSQNLDKLDENLIMVLENWSKQILANITTQQAYSLGKDIVNFGNIILGFSGGNIATNKEIVIASYKIALNAFNFNIYPQNWAMTQSNLATVYLDRIKDDKAENLEKAIKAYIEALKGFSFEKFPQDWASINNALGRAYSNRIRGNKVENMEMAIAAYTNALKVFTFDRFPYRWANINNQLGTLYYWRTKGIKKDNLEISIFCFQSYLKVYTSESLSSEYAQGQFNLGETYLQRIKGDKAENIENAIICYRESLKIYSRDKFPAKWSTVQTSLGIAYCERIKGNKSDNLENAIDYFKLSLQIRTCDTFPIDWAGEHLTFAMSINT
jgi:tetratricopeptide (TPR) repeat protein